MKKLLLLWILIMSTFSISNVTANNRLAINGHLICAIGSSLYDVDLKNKHKKEIYTQKEKEIMSVSQVDANWILVGIQDIDKGDFIIKFNLKTHEEVPIGKGSLPFYMKTYNGVLFHRLGLNVASLDNFEKTSQFIKKCEREDNDLIPISNQEVVFIDADKSQSNNIWMYNIQTNQSKLLPIKHCTLPQLWRSKTKQLMCFDRESEQYFLTDLDGSNTQYLKTPQGFSPILYIPERDELFFNANTVYISKECLEKFKNSPRERKFCGAEVGNLGIYDFKTGEQKIFYKDLWLSRGKTIYIPDKNNNN